MCGECGDVPAVRVELKLMVSGCQVKLGEDRSSIQLMDYIIHGGGDVPFTLDGDVRLSHVNANSHLVRVLWLGWCDDRGNPWCRACDHLNDVFLLKLFQLLFDLLPDVKGNSPMWLTCWLNVFVDVEFHLKVSQFSNALEQLWVSL